MTTVATATEAVVKVDLYYTYLADYVPFADFLMRKINNIVLWYSLGEMLSI